MNDIVFDMSLIIKLNDISRIFNKDAAIFKNIKIFYDNCKCQNLALIQATEFPPPPKTVQLNQQ
jgi:hypothetical protein